MKYCQLHIGDTFSGVNDSDQFIYRKDKNGATMIGGRKLSVMQKILHTETPFYLYNNGWKDWNVTLVKRSKRKRHRT